MEKIIVAFESEKTALRVKELLEGGGAAACLVCRTADQVRRAIAGGGVRLQAGGSDGGAVL